jgi:hypothetical protein
LTPPFSDCKPGIGHHKPLPFNPTKGIQPEQATDLKISTHHSNIPIIMDLSSTPVHPSNTSTTQEDQPDDPFAPLHNLEDQYYTEGYALGVADGTRSGRIEGRLFGLEKGFSKAVEMGRLGGRGVVWRARVNAPAQNSSNNGESGRATRLKGTDRLRRNVERLVELTDPESLETKNEEDAVNEFDARLAGAKAKATLISRTLGEAGNDGLGPTSPSGMASGAVGGDGGEVEISRSAREPDRTRGNGNGNGSGRARRTGEMEDFAGLPFAQRGGSSS